LSFDNAKKKVLIESSSSQKLDNKVLEPVSKSDTRSSILVDCWEVEVASKLRTPSFRQMK